MKHRLPLRFPVSALAVPGAVDPTVKKAPPGGGFGLLALVPWWLRHCGLRSISTQSTEDGIGLAPAGLVAAMARTQAQAAAKNPAYAIGRNGCAQLKARTGAALLAGCFGHTGPAFSTGKQTIRLRLSAWGRAGHLRPVALTRMAPRANRIAYRGRHLAEWWRVLPLGYEQGFTLAQAPAGSGKIVLQLSANRAPTIEHGTPAWGRLRYGKLHVTDAQGTVLPATLTAHGKLITLTFDTAHARYPVTVDPLVWVQQEVTASDGAAGDEFGSSVAISANGATALVGAWHKTVGTNGWQGAAYVYTLANNTWSQAAELTASDGAALDQFGWSVALSADGATALVGADDKTIGIHSGQGAAYVYTMPSSGWVTTSTYSAELTASDGVAWDDFGGSVALSANGGTALVGVPGKTVGGNSGQGAAYVYTMPSSGWASTSAYTAELTASDGAVGDQFGISVALSTNGATALVGAGGKTGSLNLKQGAAYVYTKPSSGWATTATYSAELTASDGATNDHFGYSVVLSTNGGTTALVGALYKTVGGNSQQGAAYVYTKPGSGWASTSAYTTELTASDGAANDNFGHSVALSADGATALVGANKTAGGNSNQGAAYFFTGSDLSAVLFAPTSVLPGDQFDSRYILTNASASASGPITVTLPLPGTGAGFVSFGASQGGCNYDATIKVATCQLGSIAGNGGSAWASLTLKATGAVGSTIAQSGQLLNASPNLVQTASTSINNSSPIASNLTLSTYTDQALSGTLSAVVTPSSDALNDAIVSQPTHGTVTLNAGTGAFTYTPNSGYSGSDSFTFNATDAVTLLVSNTATVSITVNPIPPPGQVPPVASNLNLTTYAGQALSGTLPAVVTPSSDTLSYAAAQPSHGTVTVNATTGAFTYTPDGSYNGSDSFTFTAKDTVTGLSSNTASVNITVKKAPSSGGGGGGSFGLLALFGLLLLALVPWWLRHRGLRSTSTQPTEDIPMKHHLQLRFLVSTLAALMLSLAALPAFAAPGDIDTTFNGGVPVVQDSIPSATFQPYAAAMNPLNGDILWAGYYQTNVDQGGAINIYRSSDGSLDPAVGSGGEITLTAAQAGFTSGNLYLYAIAVDGQGRILAAGDVVHNGAPIMILARFTPKGILDTGFGAASTGIVVDPLNNYAFANGLSLTADGHILVTGAAAGAGVTGLQLTVWRFNPDGTADTTFNSTGHVQIAAVTDPNFETCLPALQPDGALIVGCQLDAAESWKLTRLQADGTVDTAFGSSGFVTSTANRVLTGLALAPDGGFIISELDTSQSPNPLDMRRYLAAGTVDPGFNSGSPLGLGTVPGVITSVPVAVQPDGKILISGNDGGNGLAIRRFLADGTGDGSFGSGGKSDINFNNIVGHNYTPNATALLLQGDGKIVASGWATSNAGSGDAAFVTRVLSDIYNLTPTAPAFTDVPHAPLGQAIASNAVAVGGMSIGNATSGFTVALATRNGKYGTSTGGPWSGNFTGTNVTWVPAGNGSQLALEQMTPTTGGTATITTVVLGGFWAANNYEIPLGSPPTASWTTTTDQPPVASAGTLSATTAKAATGTLSATNPSSGTLTFAIMLKPTHGTATITNPATGAYSYTSAAGFAGADSFTWKVNDGVADSNTATVSITVKKTPPPPSGGGGSLSALGLLALALLGFGAMFRRRRGF